MADQEQNRSEAATPFKIQEARRRGFVPRSIETTSFFMLAAAAAGLFFCGRSIADQELRHFAGILASAGGLDFNVAGIHAWGVKALVGSFSALAPLFVLLMVVAILTNVLQTGPVLSSTPLKPDFERLNPVAGLKRLFSLRMLMEAGKTLVKAGLLCAVLYWGVIHALPALFALIDLSPRAYGEVLGGQTIRLVGKLLAVLALVAAIDLAFNRWDYFQKLRMSRRELREEIKRREGDPRVKQRLRELQRETVKRSVGLQRVKDADVLITNPVHLAVAVRYERDKMDAPLLIAKGSGELAAHMKTIARRHGVPIVENRKLARALFHRVRFDAPIPERYFADVAKILVWVYSLRDARRKAAAS